MDEQVSSRRLNTNDNKPPLFGPSSVFDPANYEPRSGKTFWMAATDVSSPANKELTADTSMDL